MDLKESDILGDGIASHWYYRSKAGALRKAVAGHAPKAILDVGAGSAFFSRFLLAGTGAAEAWCVDICYPEEADAQEGGKTIHYRRRIESCNADLVLLMDVLEHVDDDVGLLADYVRKVPSGATFVISVPAFQFLWSGHDKFLEHKRRYSLRQIESVARDAGLVVERGAYFFAAVFPLAAASRFLGRLVDHESPPCSQLKRHNVVVNSALSLLCHLELPFFRANRLGGLSAFCVARKP